MFSRRSLGTIAVICVLILCTVTTVGAREDTVQRVVYVSDLSPSGDADDWYDAAVLYSLGWKPSFILDNSSGIQLQASGEPAIRVLNEITGRRVVPVIGLESPLRTPRDKALGQVEQGGVRHILATLRASARRLPIVTVGSLRDIAAGYNRSPRLFERKVSAILVFAGDASPGTPLEPNVRADPKAFLRVMSSGLPVRWVPSFDGGSWMAGTHSSFVQLPQAALADALPEQYRRLLDVRFDEPLRNLWAGPLLEAAVRERVIRNGHVIAGWEPSVVYFDDDGSTETAGPHVAHVDLFTVRDGTRFAEFMRDATIERLSSLTPAGDAPREPAQRH